MPEGFLKLLTSYGYGSLLTAKTWTTPGPREMGVEATKDLINRARVGDGGAFSQLVELYRDRLECLIHLRMGARLRKRIEVDDVFQETLLRAWQSAQDFRWGKNGSFFRWLGGIAEHVIKNLARRHFKTRKRDPHREVAICRLEALGDLDRKGIPLVFRGHRGH